MYEVGAIWSIHAGTGNFDGRRTQTVQSFQLDQPNIINSALDT